MPNCFTILIKPEIVGGVLEAILYMKQRDRIIVQHIMYVYRH